MISRRIGGPGAFDKSVLAYSPTRWFTSFAPRRLPKERWLERRIVARAGKVGHESRKSRRPRSRRRAGDKEPGSSSLC